MLDGRLIDIMGDSATVHMGIRRLAKVSDAVVDGSWAIRRSRRPRLREVADRIMSLKPPYQNAGLDLCLWRHDQLDFKANFSAFITWDYIRSRRSKQPWSRIIWFPQGIPKFAFISWLAVKNRFATWDKTWVWGCIQQCRLCGEPNETRDHLFFGCPYSYTVWLDVVGSLLGAPPNPDWGETMAFLLNNTFDRNIYILTRLTFQSTIYHLWRERNAQKHNGTCQPSTLLARLIYKTIRNKVSSLWQRGNPQYQLLLQRWFSSKNMPWRCELHIKFIGLWF